MATPTTKRPEPTAPRRSVRNNAMLLRLISRVLVGALVVAVAIVLVAHARPSSAKNCYVKREGGARKRKQGWRLPLVLHKPASQM